MSKFFINRPIVATNQIAAMNRIAAMRPLLDRVEKLYEALDAARADGRLELTIVRGTEERAVTVAF